MVEEVFSKCTVFTFVLHWLFFFFPFFVKFSIIMGTSVQKDIFFFFLAMSGPFIEELLNKCFHLQENTKKIFK